MRRRLRAARGFFHHKHPDSRQYLAIGLLAGKHAIPSYDRSASEGDVPAAKTSWANANDRFPRTSLSRVEDGDGIVEGRNGSDVSPQSSVPHPLDNLA